ncbi:UbiA-like polyprenyltransferase [Engelhardtia mirabilis]|uniref:4-hydroxybenzoate polyprenyltransferase n=1 Tax=Engelhardtia mirabilis TaxID=2528011 RepID=A0A518BJA1_9BACT|nr:4-hydroxybenzoate octaprenyltransferase [Planctomycetes bacterium Pla133]QDV01378.1 4-hydroxybenzoate octaprenyltransferase [Planctomycetes bacterium Pla86]
MIAALSDHLRLVKFSHSIFALPFALASAWVAAGGPPSARLGALVVVCAVAARTAAMGFNRLVDRHIDAKNPRTIGRELPSGKLTPAQVGALVLMSCAVFVIAAIALNPLAGQLSPVVLAVLLGYSFAKRFTWAVHLWLGLSLALAPLGAWVAVRGNLEGDLLAPLALAGAVLTWVAGFDLIYACQDAAFDRGQGLHSIPARFGVSRALSLSSLLHVATALLLVAFGWSAGLGIAFALALLVTGSLLVWQHRLVRPDDLSRVDMAFFSLNGWIGLLLFVGVAVDLALGSGIQGVH